jgi:hypothetical protein
MRVCAFAARALPVWFWLLLLLLLLVLLLLLRWHPRCVSGLLVLPLCGAALTFFAAAKKVSKESGLTPPILDLYPRALNVPVLIAAACSPTSGANASNKRPTHFIRSYSG